MELTNPVVGKKESEVAVTDVLTTVFESENISEVWSGIVLWVKNTGLKDITVANVDVSPDKEEWFSLDTTTLKATISATNKLLKVEGYPFVRVQMNCGAGDSTTIDIGLTAVAM